MTEGPRAEFDGPASRASWEAAADAWNEFVESGADYYRHEVHGPALVRACQPLGAKRILDLGCGQGYLARELARRGATVTGVDHAEALIAHARTHEARERLGIEYHVMDARDIGRRWPAGTFDLVAACMSVQDMHDTAAVLGSVRAVLETSGRFTFSIPHPGTETARRSWRRDETGKKIALQIGGYFETGPAICHWNMRRLRQQWTTPYWRRTIAEWSTLAADAGFMIRRLDEPRPTAEQVSRRPELWDCHDVPYFLIFDLVVAHP